MLQKVDEERLDKVLKTIEFYKIRFPVAEISRKLKRGKGEVSDYLNGKKPIFRKVADQIGLSKDFTIYGAKHTRVIHLTSAGVPEADIMNNTGHKDHIAFSLYKRDLGLTADIKNINAKSRKI